MNHKILRIALPSIVSNITVPLLGLVDTAITGHLGAASYIGAVAVGSAIFSMIYWIFGFLRMGTGGLTAQALGADDDDACLLILLRALLMGAAIALVLVVLQQPLLQLSLSIMDATPEVEAGARTYFHVLIWGAPAVLCTYGMMGWFLGMQDAKSPMYIAITQNVINIAVSLGLVVCLGWKVEGVATGTLVSQWSGLLLAALLWRRKGLRLSPQGLRRRILEGTALRKFFDVNRDIFLRTLCIVAVLTYFTAAGAQQGDVILAVNALLMQFSMVFSYVMDGFAYAGEALGGRFYGARDTVSLHRLMRYLFGWGCVLVAVCMTGFAIAGHGIVALLTDNAAVRSAAEPYLPYAIAFPAASFAAFIYDGLFIGTTRTRGMLWAVGTATAVFFTLYFALRPALANHALWVAYLAYLAVRGVVQYFLYRHYTRSGLW